MNVTATRLSPGQDLKETLLTLCRDRDIDAACIVTAVGSVTDPILRMAGATEGTTLSGNHEIVSLVGTLSRHGAHLHISLSDAEGVVRGGHLMPGTKVFTTAEIMVGVLAGLSFRREHDERTGYRELVIEAK